MALEVREFNMLKFKKAKKKQYDNINVSFTGEDLRAAVLKKARELRKHFREDGWDISYSNAESDILNSIIGVDVLDLIFMELQSRTGVDYALEGKGLVLRDCEYEPVLYDVFSDEIIMPGRDYDVFKFSEYKGYFYLGRL